MMDGPTAGQTDRKTDRRAEKKHTKVILKVKNAFRNKIDFYNQQWSMSSVSYMRLYINSVFKLVYEGAQRGPLGRTVLQC